MVIVGLKYKCVIGEIMDINQFIVNMREVFGQAHIIPFAEHMGLSPLQGVTH